MMMEKRPDRAAQKRREMARHRRDEEHARIVFAALATVLTALRTRHLGRTRPVEREGEIIALPHDGDGHACGLQAEELGVGIRKLQSGPLGGDQQLGALIADGDIDFLVFFWDPLEQQPHDTDVKALLRIAVVWNIPVACDRASADFMISSPLMESEYQRRIPDYHTYIERFNEGAG